MRSPSPRLRGTRGRRGRSPPPDYHQNRQKPQDPFFSNRKKSAHRSRSPPPTRRIKSNSPSPPRPSKRELQTIRITTPNVQERQKHQTGTMCSKQDEPKFRGAEDELPRSKEQRKIQIEIRRSIPGSRSSSSPARRSIRDPSNVFLCRRRDEGEKAIFDREEIKRFVPDVPEKRVVAILNDSFDNAQNRDRNRRSRSPLTRSSDDRMHQGDKRTSVRDRLGNHQQKQDHQKPRTSIRDRLGGESTNLDDDDRVLNRDELESLRPDVKPWEINPEYVPRSHYYFEHDNREDLEPFNKSGRGNFIPRGNRGFNHRGSGDFRDRGLDRADFRDRDRADFRDDRGRADYSNRGDFRGRGRGGRASWRGGRGNYNNRQGYNNRSHRDDSPDWKHDKFNDDAMDVEPSSTT